MEGKLNDQELFHLWDQTVGDTDRRLSVNQRAVLNDLEVNANTSMKKLKRFKLTGIIFSIPYLLFLGLILLYALIDFKFNSVYFIVSVSVILSINVVAVLDYIRHYFIAKNLDFSRDLMENQDQLVKLQLSILRHNRLMGLQFPFFTTFYLSPSWFPGNMDWPYLLFQFGITLIAVIAAAFFYHFNSPSYVSKKWVRNSSGGKSVAEAIQIMEEMNHLRSNRNA
jgi:hypothetical protein